MRSLTRARAMRNTEPAAASARSLAAIKLRRSVAVASAINGSGRDA